MAAQQKESKGNGSAKKASSKKQPAKKSAKKKGNGNGAALADRILELGAGNGVDKAARKLTGKYTHKDVLALRDAIKEAAAKAREAENTDLADALSQVNRQVRRLERSLR